MSAVEYTLSTTCDDTNEQSAGFLKHNMACQAAPLAGPGFQDHYHQQAVTNGPTITVSVWADSAQQGLHDDLDLVSMSEKKAIMPTTTLLPVTSPSIPTVLFPPLWLSGTDPISNSWFRCRQVITMIRQKIYVLSIMTRLRDLAFISACFFVFFEAQRIRPSL